MNILVEILEVKNVNYLNDYWSENDFRGLLQEFDFPDANDVASNELKEMLFMAINDFEPHESAEILLKYKLGDKLSEGQMQNLSHEMLADKVAEEYPDPAFHYDLFNINQLLYLAYNGKFPNTEATIMKIKLTNAESMSKEILIKALQGGLKEHSLINRLYEDQLEGAEDFTDAGKIVWKYTDLGSDTFEVISSKYFVEEEDFEKLEFSTEIKFFKSKEE